ncbi:MAG: YlxR family protein [Dehalococcoidales bacterium]|nr:YlxR family protein [Dehalococcoidales bacterium]
MKTRKSINASTNPVKHVPQRTCIACRKIGAKRNLVRIVKTNDEGLVVDITGKKPGRGYYLCDSRGCWEKILEGNRLEHVIHTALTRQDYQGLKEYAEGLQQE